MANKNSFDKTVSEYLEYYKKLQEHIEQFYNDDNYKVEDIIHTDYGIVFSFRSTEFDNVKLLTVDDNYNKLKSKPSYSDFSYVIYKTANKTYYLFYLKFNENARIYSSIDMRLLHLYFYCLNGNPSFKPLERNIYKLIDKLCPYPDSVYQQYKYGETFVIDEFLTRGISEEMVEYMEKQIRDAEVKVEQALWKLFMRVQKRIVTSIKYKKADQMNEVIYQKGNNSITLNDAFSSEPDVIDKCAALSDNLFKTDKGDICLSVDFETKLFRKTINENDDFFDDDDFDENMDDDEVYKSSLSDEPFRKEEHYKSRIFISGKNLFEIALTYLYMDIINIQVNCYIFNYSKYTEIYNHKHIIPENLQNLFEDIIKRVIRISHKKRTIIDKLFTSRKLMDVYSIKQLAAFVKKKVNKMFNGDVEIIYTNKN